MTDSRSYGVSVKIIKKKRLETTILKQKIKKIVNKNLIFKGLGMFSNFNLFNYSLEGPDLNHF